MGYRIHGYGLKLPLFELFVVLAATAAVCGGAREYGYDFSESQRWSLQNYSNQTMTRMLLGMDDHEYEHVTRELMIFDYDLTVEQLENDGSAWIRCDITRIRVEDETMGYYVTYDSEEDLPVPQQFEALSMLVGQSYRLHITPVGLVEDADVEQMHENIEEKLQDNPDGEEIMQGLQRQFSRDRIIEQTQMMLAIYPDEPVRLGQRWQRQLNFSLVSPMVIEQEWMIRGMRNDSAIISSEATISNADAPRRRRRDVGHTEIDVTGTQTGRSEVDIETGRIIESEKQRSLEGTLYMSLPGTDERMDVPVKIESLIRVTMDKINGGEID